MRQKSVAQHSVHPTGGSRRVFGQFVWLKAGSAKMAFSRPAHQRVTPAVGLPNDNIRQTLKRAFRAKIGVGSKIIEASYTEMKNRILVAFVLVLVVQVSYGAPEQSYPASMPTAITANVPKLILRGESQKFSIKTTPGIECYAGIGYYNTEDKLIFMELPKMESDKDGMCEWTWKIPADAPADAKDGLGVFRGYVQEEDQNNDIFPAKFCIGRCP